MGGVQLVSFDNGKIFRSNRWIQQIKFIIPLVLLCLRLQYAMTHKEKFSSVPKLRKTAKLSV